MLWVFYGLLEIAGLTSGLILERVDFLDENFDVERRLIA